MVKFNSAVRFKCTQSDNIYSFEHEHDIKAMRKHPDYVELVEEEPKKSVGRPTKKEVESVEEA